MHSALILACLDVLHMRYCGMHSQLFQARWSARAWQIELAGVRLQMAIVCDTLNIGGGTGTCWRARGG